MGREKDDKHKELRRDSPTSGLQARPGRVPSVPWKCPVCPSDILSNLCRSTQIRSGHPGCPRIRPQTVTETLLRQTDRKIPLCVLCLSVLFSLLQFLTININNFVRCSVSVVDTELSWIVHFPPPSVCRSCTGASCRGLHG